MRTIGFAIIAAVCLTLAPGCKNKDYENCQKRCSERLEKCKAGQTGAEMAQCVSQAQAECDSCKYLK
jgi:hypothetical protein